MYVLETIKSLFHKQKEEPWVGSIILHLPRGFYKVIMDDNIEIAYISNDKSVYLLKSYTEEISDYCLQEKFMGTVTIKYKAYKVPKWKVGDITSICPLKGNIELCDNVVLDSRFKIPKQMIF